jgi:hypothetical protein
MQRVCPLESRRDADALAPRIEVQATASKGDGGAAVAGVQAERDEAGRWCIATCRGYGRSPEVVSGAADASLSVTGLTSSDCTRA